MIPGTTRPLDYIRDDISSAVFKLTLHLALQTSIMRVIQIQRLAMSGLSRKSILGTVASSSPRSSNAITQNPFGGPRSLWSGVRSFGKTLKQMADMFKQRAASNPNVHDGVNHPVVEPLKSVVWPEHPEMEKSVNVWVSW